MQDQTYITRRSASASFARNRNTVRYNKRSLGSISQIVIVSMLTLVFGLIYVAEGTKATSFDYELSSVESEIYGLNAAYANMTFGQNLSLTMIQTATAFSSVINGGYWRTPTVVKGELVNGEVVPLDTRRVTSSEGVPRESRAGEETTAGPAESRIEDKILSDETSAMMRDMLINNRNYKVRGGIDRAGYAVGGKSGTAQVIKNGAYDDTMSETVGTYIGFVGPEGELPKYVIMVKMWGDGQYLDGGIASNLFDDLSNYVIDYLKIKPSNG